MREAKVEDKIVIAGPDTPDQLNAQPVVERFTSGDAAEWTAAQPSTTVTNVAWARTAPSAPNSRPATRLTARHIPVPVGVPSGRWPRR